jgi:hypothetical protein
MILRASFIKNVVTPIIAFKPSTVMPVSFTNLLDASMLRASFIKSFNLLILACASAIFSAQFAMSIAQLCNGNIAFTHFISCSQEPSVLTLLAQFLIVSAKSFV